MVRSKRMEPVVKVAQGRERDAARLLGERQRLLQAQEQRLEELNAYRAEYARNFEETARAGGFSVLRLRNFRLFLEQLDQAIEQQRGVVTAAHQEVASSRARWASVRSRAQAVDHMVERMRREEHQERERREQRESDERGQRRKDPH